MIKSNTSVVMATQTEVTLPPRDIDGYFAEFSFVETCILLISFGSALTFAQMNLRIYVAISIWCGIGLMFVTLHFRFNKRKALLKKNSSVPENGGNLRLGDNNITGEEFEDCFEDGSFLEGSTLDIAAKNRNMSVPSGCIRIIQARAHSSYAEYRIVISLNNSDGNSIEQWEVWRRYSEFSGLRAKLRSRHLYSAKGGPAGWAPQPLPAKSLRRHLDEKYLKGRGSQLEKFLLVLLNHPKIRNSDEMRAFLCFGTPSQPNPTSKSSSKANNHVTNPLGTLKEEGRTSTDSSQANNPLQSSSSTTAAAPSNQLTPEEVDQHIIDVCAEGNQPNIEGQWREARTEHDFQLRGQFYMTDRVKEHTGDGVCNFVAARVYHCRKDIDGDRLDHIATKGTFKVLMDKLQKITAPYREPNEAVFFVVNIQIPGTPVVHVVQVFALPTKYSERYPDSTHEKFRNMFRKYYEDLPISDGSEAESSLTVSPELGTCPLDHFRNQRFKLVPKVVDGPWIVKRTIPSKPALLGQKLTQRYFRGECYVETDIHVGSSMVANNITGVGRSASNQLHIDMGYALEGRAEDELPEKLLGVGRFTNLDVSKTCTIVDGL